ncbi:tRNA epoxyqueuosine(34) reductase QueG [Alicyclobacillus mengziensis]|uniref:tRNA epoxyqueuosine(34) reductase QueG n=1 Tax=Alicyclobacillus mengziensis TaxID=2931921 RepID=A0A9X7W0I5_9BACL|nr:tRNA epoxyqueuosine(34) reductase QueG [Alicyclobacillus mengziensis]QSO48217.1 tRNA epoxyqueuosine(34) reductase QueG [Alicyclobacillus mengziensis]
MPEVSYETLNRTAKQAGFDAVGATSADPFPELVPRLQAYEKRGRTGFEYADIDARVNPKAWFPPAKSLISVAMAYLTAEGRQLARKHPRQGFHGQVTVYSYGQDYHNVMAERMRELVCLLEQEVGRHIESKVAIDTAPLVDRRVAERAGLGWVGKNCMFYTPQHGSFVFLGTLAVDVDVETAKSEVIQRCGSCTLCLDACPTGALVAPGVIDATRCLSYITQMKGVIPRDYRAAMGKRVWGCDTCQWACPENRNVLDALHEEYMPSLPPGELEFPDLVEVLQWTNKSFAKRYGHTAAAWRGVRIWQRNALIALGNTRTEEAVRFVTPFLTHDRKELRISAAWALGKIGGGAALDALKNAINAETDALVLEEIRNALEEAESE